MKKGIVFIACFIIVILGVITGIRLYNKTNKEVEKNNYFNGTSTEVVTIEDRTSIANTISTMSTTEKTTSKTLIIFKTYYAKCNHYINEYKDIDASCVNLTEEEFEEKYKTWKLTGFSPEEVILEKQEDKYCNQHYLLKLNGDTLTIYLIDEYGNEKEYEKTDITSKYLTTEDILNLQSGIKVYGKESLISTIEDFE